jgi:phosphoribosylanthranilate isomerase
VPPEVKICGLTRPEDAAAAARAGAAFLGAVFVNGSPRVVSSRRATAIFAAANGEPLKRVGVFAGLSAGEILDIASRARLDVLQLHEPPAGDLLAALRRGFGGEIWLVVRVAAGGLTDHDRGLFGRGDATLVDTHSPRGLGGTGDAFDWSALAPAVAAARGGGRLALAGGLSPENVGKAIALLHPDIVDVSSGVESAPGVKDSQRIASFIRAARGERS